MGFSASEVGEPAAAASAGARQSVREVTYDLLRGLGLTTVFGNPGSTELTLLCDFPDDFDFVLGLHEAAAVGLANGYAHATRRPSLVLLHSSPGFGNAVGALVTAAHNRYPLVVIVGTQDRRHLALEPFLGGDLMGLGGTYVKHASMPVQAADVPAAILRAHGVASQAPCGPAVVVVPMDDWDARCDAVPARTVAPPQLPSPAVVRDVVERLSGARRPVIVAGAGLDREPAWAQAVALAERLGVPVWGEPMAARAGFPQRHPQFAGHLLPEKSVVRAALEGCDLALVLGAPVFRYYPYEDGPVLPDGCEVLQLTDDPQEAARTQVGHSVVGALAPLLEMITAHLPGVPLQAAPDRSASPVADAPATAALGPPTTEDVLHVIAARITDETVIVEEAPSARPALQRLLRVNMPGGYASAGGGGLGFGVPAAIGIKLAVPERPVVCVVGDGSTLFGAQALWSAAELRLPVVFVVLSNRGYGILRLMAAGMRGGAAVPGLEIGHLDIGGLAASMGCAVARIDRLEQFGPALDRALRAARPTVVEVETAVA